MIFKKEIVFLTGGGGFLGKVIAKQLINNGYIVKSFSRKRYPQLTEMGVECISGDIRSQRDVVEASKGCTAIIHTAAKAGIWGRKKDFFSINVDGTLNVIEAAKKNKIDKIIYTSSPSVVFSGADIQGAGVRIPYASKFLCHYPYTKKLAEELILKSHQNHSLQTVALRPHLIWGPNDPHFFPRIVQRARQGRLMKVGPLDNMVDVIYVDNAARAHVQALEKMILDQSFGGKAYFIGQERPVKLWKFVDDLLLAAGEPRLAQFSIPFSIAYGLGSILEILYRLCSCYHKEPPMTRFVAQQLSYSHYFSHNDAVKDFSYKPQVSIEEGLSNLRKQPMLNF
jgi:nucleoside-diphosphate-sugar epimerase